MPRTPHPAEQIIQMLREAEVELAQGATLRPESPALKLGFQQIPWQEIGLQPGPNRASWPVEHLNLPREERVGPQY